MRFGRSFYLAVILICAFEIARLWNITPAQMAAHFDIQGNPDRFVPKAQFFWFQVQTMGIVILVSFLPQILFLAVPVRFINMPNREYWLSPERSDETLDRLSSFGTIMFGIILIVIQVGFELAAYANLQSPVFFNAGVMIPVMIGSFILIGLMLIRLIASFRVPSSDE